MGKVVNMCRQGYIFESAEASSLESVSKGEENIGCASESRV